MNGMRRRPWPRRLRSRLFATPFAQAVDLRGKKIIVTGASPGSIGFETARTLSAWGADLVVTTRSNPQDAVAALAAAGPAARISGQALDLSQAGSVARFAGWYAAEHGKQLDVLINNAGVHLDLLSQWKEPRLTPDGYEIHWRTNYLGSFHLTQRLLPLLQATAAQAGEARIVNVVSMLHARGSNAALFAAPVRYNSWNAYGTSKLALVHATFELQRRYAAAKVQAYCLHPGAVFTNIAGKGLAGNRMIGSVRNALSPVEGFFLMNPEEGAQTQIHCATFPGLAGGLYYDKCRPAQPSADALDAGVGGRLWGETLEWVESVG